MNGLQIFTTIFDVAWLMGLLTLLWLIWRSSERRANQTQYNQDVLVGVIQQNVDNNRQAIQMTNDALELLQESMKKRE